MRQRTAGLEIFAWWRLFVYLDQFQHSVQVELVQWTSSHILNGTFDPCGDAWFAGRLKCASIRSDSFSRRIFPCNEEMPTGSHATQPAPRRRGMLEFHSIDWPSMEAEMDGDSESRAVFPLVRNYMTPQPQS